MKLSFETNIIVSSVLFSLLCMGLVFGYYEIQAQDPFVAVSNTAQVYHSLFNQFLNVWVPKPIPDCAEWPALRFYNFS